MMASRGMGVIASSKRPKKTVKKRDGNEPVKLYKKGGKVRRFSEGGEAGEKDMSRDVEERQKVRRGDSSDRRPSGFRFTGEGGRDKFVTAGGGRLSYDIPAGRDATISPYVEGFVAKPKDRELMGRITGAGVMYNKQFKSGGSTTKSKVNKAGNYTKPGMRKALFNQIKGQATQGTAAGQWSARKAQLLATKYKEKGGGYK